MLRTLCRRLYRRLVGRREVSSVSGGGVCCVVSVLECVCFRVCISVYACMFIFMCVCVMIHLRVSVCACARMCGYLPVCACACLPCGV